jgi:hypothetical protein
VSSGAFYPLLYEQQRARSNKKKGTKDILHGESDLKSQFYIDMRSNFKADLNDD